MKTRFAIFAGLAATAVLLVLLPSCTGGRLYSYSDPSRVGRLQHAPQSAAESMSLQLQSGRAMGLQQQPATSSPRSIDEVWVIAKPQADVVAAAPVVQDEVPGCGSMVCVPPLPAPQPQATEPAFVALPLKHTDVRASISAFIASVDVTQQFHNPYDGKIEAVYVFPLPHNAAVSEFLMTIGERTIRGIIRERAEAERIYHEARAQGHVASLLTQERPNIFTQKVANIEPGRSIDVTITYFHTLACDDGWFEFAFPMVVGPRFNPPGFVGGVAALPRGSLDQAGQATAVQYLRAHERSGHDISLEVAIDAGVPIEEVRCATHEVEISGLESQQARVALSPRDSIPNRDFVLRYRAAGDAIRTALLAHRDQRGGYFALMVLLDWLRPGGTRPTAPIVV
ncbi:MAG: hypothetical protein L0271_01530, partial [Gemmatimonadetes bacterium]|nr:hypothetical protein [Gemmatimonadota bacterium]